MRLLAFTIVLMLALVLAGKTFARSLQRPRTVDTPAELARYQQFLLNHHLYVAHKGRGRPRFVSRRAVRWIARELRETKARIQPPLPPHWRQWSCIHHYEGAWNANTGNGFYGGLQFMQSTWVRNGGLRYASRADLASPVEQMWIAENAWRESGGSFSQWPNTARYCGLL